MRTFAQIPLIALLSREAFGQSAKPVFQVADVHVSAPSRNQNMQGGVLQAGRYEIRRATMLDLIKTAYVVDADTVFGGPSWLEWDRYDVVAKAPAGTSAATVRLMLQALLADRFKLVVHKDTKPIQGFVLAPGKGKHKLKAASGSGEPGCLAEPPPPPNPDSIPPRVVSCHGVTMEEFAPQLRSFAGGYLPGPVLDSTGLKGAWDFDVKWTEQLLLPLAGADAITVFDAVDKQLGLKLEPGKVPMPVLVVDSASEKPSANPPEVKTALPPLPSPEFEVASIRSNPPGAPLGGPGGLLPGGGRYEQHGFPMWIMIRQAWDVNTLPGEEIPGTPKWLDMYNPLFDIVAKVPATAIASGTQLFTDDLQAMMRALLLDRFKMKVHYEDRPMDAYTLVAAKPKMKTADAANRTGCKAARPTPIDLTAGPPPLMVTCQNVTMAQFAERLQSIAPIYLRYPVLDGSGIQGAWDFTLSFSPVDPNRAGGGGGRGGTKGGGPAPGVLSDPVGGLSLFDAVDKQLGLKLEKHQRSEPVLVIDHIEEKPTEN